MSDELPRPDAAAEFRAPADYNLQRSLGAVFWGGFDPRWRRGEHDVLWAWRGPMGPLSLRAEQAGRDLRLELWGDDSGWALERGADLLGLSDRPGAFVCEHPRLRDWQRRFPGVYLPRTHRVLECLVPVVMQQLITFREAMRGYRALLHDHGEEAVGGLRVLPSAEKLRRVPDYSMRASGISGRQVATIRALASYRRALEECAAWDYRAARERLDKMKGVGIWTREVVMARCFGDPDALPLGDLHLANDVAFALCKEERADDDRMVELLEPFRGHRWRVIRLIRMAGLSAPRRQPRRTPRWRR